MSFKRLNKQSRQFRKEANLDELQNNMAKGMGEFKTLLEGQMKEIIKITTPRAKKNVSIKEVNCAMSLIEDGRVIIQFPSMKDCEDYFANPCLYDKADIQEAIEDGRKEGKESKDKEWRNKSWFRRLFI